MANKWSEIKHKKDRIPDHVQLQLRMTEVQIYEQRRKDRECADRSDGRASKRDYDRAVEQRYDRAVLSKSYVRPKGEFHYRYHAGLARDVADRKEDRTVRRYWNRVAKKLEEKADGFIKAPK